MMPPAFQSASDSLRTTLLRLGRQMRRAALLREGGLWLAATLGVWLAVFLADNLLKLPAGLRLPLTLAAIAVTVQQGWRRLAPALRRGATPERAACELERRLAIRDNLLIDACQFETAAPDGWTAGLVRSAQGCARTVDAVVVFRPAELRRAAMLAGLLLLGWALYLAAWPRGATNAWTRLTRPLAEPPPLGTVRIAVSPAQDLEVFAGDSLRIVAHLTGPDAHRPPTLRRGPARRGATLTTADAMTPAPGDPAATTARYTAEIHDLRESFAFRVEAGGTWSPPVRVTVRTLPRVIESAFVITPPAYLEQPPRERPGIPHALAAPAGSVTRLTLRLAPAAGAVVWNVADRTVPLGRADGAWNGVAEVSRDGHYTLDVAIEGTTRVFRIAEGPVFAEPDPAPSVRIEATELNRLVWPGDEVVLEVVAADDGGLRALWLEAGGAESAARDAPPAELRRWTFVGPPGRRGTVRERWTLRVEPQRFPPGAALLVTACAQDWNPAGATARSPPLLLRIQDPRATPPGAAPDPAADALAQAVEAQRRALGLTRNLHLHRDDALREGSLPRHAQSMREAQTQARQHGVSALATLRAADRSAADRLDPLTRHEMGWALAAIERVPATPAAALAPRLTSLAERQFYILNELLTLLGQRRAAAPRPAPAGTPPAPTATRRDAAELLRAQLQQFADAQQRIVRATLPLAARGPADLTDAEEEILGRLAREEQRLAAFLKDAVDDFSKLPLQDFADGSLADEFHTVYQEVEKAAAALYEKKLELAVPLEQSALEMAEELIHNIEKWLSDKPDHTKWLMEEPPDMPLPPMAELPTELEDIVGALLDDELAMGADIEDVSSAWHDSLDKGAGWDVADGPISDMSAKAVTGNLLPNQTEIGGRAGEGRSGRSHGQMVESEAAGKGGRQTPTRLTPSPFETGSVADRSEDDPGGATGGGKLSGFAGAGLRGPAPAPRLDKMARLAGRQAEIRQDTERLRLHLRAWQAPTGAIDQAVAAMRRVEESARAGHVGELRQAYDAALDAMRATRASVTHEAALRRAAAPLGGRRAEELWAALRERLPPGYEDMVAAYYRRLAAHDDPP